MSTIPQERLIATWENQLAAEGIALSRDGLIDALDDHRLHIRGGAALLLGHREDQRAIPKLRWLLEDDVPAVRVEAAMALARLGDPLGIPVLVSALEEDILSDAPLTAAKYLAERGDVRGFELVQQALQHPLEGVRLHAAVALKYFLPCHGQVAGGREIDLVEAIRSGLRDPLPQVRGELLYKLAGLEDNRVGPLLAEIAAADPDEDVRQAAQMLLQERAQPKA